MTSINITDYTVEVRETKLVQIVTRDIPNVSEESLRHLDENELFKSVQRLRLDINGWKIGTSKASRQIEL